MKNFTLVLILLFTFNFTNLTAQWYWQNPKPQGNHLKDIIFVDDSKLATIGFGGVFLLSTNNGDSWAISYIADDLIWATDIFYTEQNHTFYAIVGGYNGLKLYSSNNDGEEWQIISSLNLEGMRNVYVFDANIWIAVGSNGKIKRTTDAGATWNDLPLVTNSELNSIKFIDNQVGLIVGSNGVILRSTDSGDSWSLVPSGITERLLKIEFYNSQIAVAVGQSNTILKTTDGGLTWTHLTYAGVNPYSDLLDVSIIDEQNFVAVGGNDDFFGGRESLVIRSSDGGNTWTELSDQFSRGLSGIASVNPNSCFAVGYSGGIYKTTDSGFNWSRISSGDYYYFWDLCTVDSSTFYITGLGQLTYLFTNNGGVTWQNVSTPDFSGSGIAFIDKDYGVLTGDSSVYKTTNGGNNWDLIYRGSSTYFTDVAILNYENILIIGGLMGSLGVIYKTSNSGVSWHQVNSGTTSSLREVVF